MKGEAVQAIEVPATAPVPQWLKIGVVVAVVAIVTISLLDLYCIVDLDQLC